MLLYRTWCINRIYYVLTFELEGSCREGPWSVSRWTPHGPWPCVGTNHLVFSLGPMCVCFEEAGSIIPAFPSLFSLSLAFSRYLCQRDIHNYLLTLMVATPMAALANPVSVIPPLYVLELPRHLAKYFGCRDVGFQHPDHRLPLCCYYRSCIC